MSDDFFRRLDQILQNSSIGTTSCIDQIRAIDWQCWAEIAGNVIAKHTQLLLNGKNGIVYADSPIWAHSVNQKRVRLLKAIQDRGFVIDSLQVRSQPSKPIGEDCRKKRKPSAISLEVAEMLKQTATGTVNDQLRMSLLKLSKLAAK